MSLVCPSDETGLIAPFVETLSPFVENLSPFLVSLSNHGRSSDKTLLNVIEGCWVNRCTNGPSTSSGRSVTGLKEYPA